MPSLKRPYSTIDQDILAPGLHIEVLWDVVQVKAGGRRSGEETVTPVWWRAEVLTFEKVQSRWKAQLRYDGREGFSEQKGEVWVFPNHVRPVEDQNTQLRWRYDECSGNITYDTKHDAYTDTLPDDAVAIYNSSSQELKVLRQDVGQLMQQHQLLERMIVAQSQLFTRVIEHGSSADHSCAKLFGILRQKLAVLMQRQIPPARNRKEDDENSFFFEVNCAGCLNTDVDCDLDTLQEVARVVRSKIPSTNFRPSFLDFMHPPPNMEEAQITFSSLGELAQVIGISSTSDLMYMALRERGNARGKDRSTADVAIRLPGTCVMDSDDDDSPTAMLTCQSVNEHCLSKEFDALVRDTRDFDFAARSCAHRLVRRKLTGESLLRVVFGSQLVDKNERQQTSHTKEISSQLRTFGLRWHPIAPPNSRVWSRPVAVPDSIHGILEVEVPFVIFRGLEVIQELKELDTAAFVTEQIRSQMLPPVKE